ncbi:MAG: SIR2 family NAD-dependent protein deacylase [Beijerinckiaceae bacterium]
MDTAILDDIASGLAAGRVVPYLGPALLELAGNDTHLPASPETLVGRLTAKASVPHKIRNNLTGAAQFIENFKHRKSVVAAMSDAFGEGAAPTPLHAYLAALPNLPLLVHAWYDDLPQRAFAGRTGWGLVQGVSQSEHWGAWVHYFRPDGSCIPHAQRQEDVQNGAHGQATAPDEALAWSTMIYQPIGSVAPAANYIVSDSDYVEVLTEIDIQTPIPEPVQNLRVGRNFLFLGCRFVNQLERQFARQIIKRSSDHHWAVLPGEPTRNERRFLEDYGIKRIDMPLNAFVEALTGIRQKAA